MSTQQAEISRNLRLFLFVLQGSLISMAFKLILLLVASWAIFFRSQRTSMPRVFLFRFVPSLIIVLVLLVP